MRNFFFLLLAIGALCAASRAADLRFGGLFTDHTVLQRDAAVPVWGWADPGETVTVTFAGQTRSATADAGGKWSVKLDAMTASAEGRELVVQSGSRPQRAVLKDIVVGEVWLCSGQSNMHFQMKSVHEAPSEIAAANHPRVRYFTVDHQFDQKPVADVRGAWRQVSPATAADCSAVAYYFGVDLEQKLGVPVGLIVSSVGGTKIETWMRAETLRATGESRGLVEKWSAVSAEEFQRIGAEYREYQKQRDEVHPQAVKAAKTSGQPAPAAPKAPRQRCHDCPSALHNGMIAPLEPFAIRGAIWYQGESNSGQPAAYEKLLPALIADWRKVWGADLPFLFVQLAPHRSTHPGFREAQHRIWQRTPRTAMVVTTDVGDAANIHPTRKKPVGARLARAARAISYGEEVEYSGPVYESMRVEDNRAVIAFTHSGTGLMAAGGALEGFTLAGADGKFTPGTAVIDGANVIVTSPAVARPVAVRYNWAHVPPGNLFSRDGLPAAPFRSDVPAVKAAGKPAAP